MMPQLNTEGLLRKIISPVGNSACSATYISCASWVHGLDYPVSEARADA